MVQPLGDNADFASSAVPIMTIRSATATRLSAR
ncbi:hypothetical protein X767_26080 [Mesorhizobium sp. LSJC264A00]|nr:hypothetical protein X767_26080 [Mesorhizobium sp. LSJC264A00]